MAKYDSDKNKKESIFLIHSKTGNTEGKNNMKDILDRIAKESNKNKKNESEWYSIEIHELISIIPEIINLFLAGFIFMTIFIWLTNLQIETYLIGIWSLIINALIKLFYSALHNFVFINDNFPEVIKHTIYVLSAIIFPFIIVKILNYDFVKRLLNKYSGKTIHKDIFEDIIDYNKRTLMVVYLKDSNVYYAGTFKVKEETGSNSYITLINYTIKDKSNHDTIIDT